jgi:integrase
MPSLCPSYIQVRDGRYFLRLRVPRDLAPALGRQELVRALGTSDGMRARIVASRIALRLPRLWQLMRDCADRLASKLKAMAVAWLRAEIDREWALLEGGNFDPAGSDSALTSAEERARHRDLFARDAEFSLESAQEEYQRHDHTRMRDAAEQLLAAWKPDAAIAPRDRAVLQKFLMEAFGQLQETKIAWTDGEVDRLPTMLVAGRDTLAVAPTALPAVSVDAPQAGVPTTSAPGRTVQRAIDDYLALRRQAGIKEKQVTDAEGDLRVLVEAFGADKLIAEIGTVESGLIWSALVSLPPHHRRHPELADLDLFEKARKAKELKLEPLHPGSIKSYLGSLKNLFEHERMAGHVTVNPFAEKAVIKTARRKKLEKEFRSHELETLFRGTVFAGAKSAERPYDPGSFLMNDWRFWAPVIALMTGARIGEIAQLRPCDVHEREGILVFDFNEDQGKSLKTDSSKRLVPVHSRLIAMGVVELASKRKALPLLLPDVPKPVAGDHGAGLSKWMSERYLVRVGLKTRPGLGFHSFRHSLKTLLRSAGVTDSVASHIIGHSPRSVDERYGSVELKTARDAIEKITLPKTVMDLRPRF